MLLLVSFWFVDSRVGYLFVLVVMWVVVCGFVCLRLLFVGSGCCWVLIGVRLCLLLLACVWLRCCICLCYC